MEDSSYSSSSSSSSSSCSSPRAAPWMQIAVRGIPLSASEEDLKNHFGRYGEVLGVAENEQETPQESDDKQAFVFFADSASAKRASASREKNNHIILGKLVEVSRFSIWLQKRRIEVYNLPPGTTSSAFRAYFEEFGTVTEAAVGPDGSGYVVFEWDESLRKVLKKKLHLFYGTELKVRRESESKAFLVANAAQHESTSSATPCAHGVADIPTRPGYTDSTRIATTPYDALYTSSYNRPTTAVPHVYSAPTPPFGTPYTSSDNRPISVTTYAYGVLFFSPYGVSATSFYDWSTTATPHVSSAPTPSLSALYTPSYNRPASAIPHAYTAPTPPFGTPYMSSDNRPISDTTYAYGAPSIGPYSVPAISFYNWPTTTTPHVSSAPTPLLSTFYTPSYNRPASAIPHAYSGLTPPFGTPTWPISVTTYAYGAPSISPYGVPSTSFYNRPTTATPHASGAPTPPLSTLYTPSYNRPASAMPHAYSKPHSKTPQIEDTAAGRRALNLDEKDNNNIDGHKVDVKQAELKGNANVSNDKKIFVGGLPVDITNDEFRAYFEKFGPITNAHRRRDKNNRPRGFGFVTFKTEESAHEVLKNQFHEMRPDKKVEVKKAIPKKEENANVSNDKKIFVGCLPIDITNDEFRAYFEKFGPITNALTRTDEKNNRPRGFGFVTFETEESAHEVLKNQFHEMRPDKKVSVKKAIPKKEENATVSNDKKIYVGRLPIDISDDELRAYFEKFGPITNALTRTDKKNSRPQGFGFVTFETEESAHEVLKNQFHEMRPDKKVVVKKVIPKIEGNIRCDNNNDHNGVSGSNNNNINNNGRKYNPGIRKFLPDENGSASIHREL